MPFCPQCRYEYSPGVLVCPDCSKTLVDQLQPRTPVAQAPDESWVIVGTVSSQMKSEMAKGSLDSNNIPSMVLSSRLSGYNGWIDFLSGAATAVGDGDVIMVPREYRDEAQLILEAVLGEEFNRLEER
jgi:hypothetical protein